MIYAICIERGESYDDLTSDLEYVGDDKIQALAFIEKVNGDNTLVRFSFWEDGEELSEYCKEY